MISSFFKDRETLELQMIIYSINNKGKRERFKRRLECTKEGEIINKTFPMDIMIEEWGFIEITKKTAKELPKLKEMANKNELVFEDKELKKSEYFHNSYQYVFRLEKVDLSFEFRMHWKSDGSFIPILNILNNEEKISLRSDITETVTKKAINHLLYHSKYRLRFLFNPLFESFRKEEKYENKR